MNLDDLRTYIQKEVHIGGGKMVPYSVTYWKGDFVARCTKPDGWDDNGRLRSEILQIHKPIKEFDEVVYLSINWKHEEMLTSLVENCKDRYETDQALDAYATLVAV